MPVQSIAREARRYIAGRPAYGADDFGAFRAQELVLIALNVCTLAVLLAVYVSFMKLIPALRNVVPLLFALRLAEQCAEGAWLWRRQEPLSAAAIRSYGHVSIWVNLAFAVTISLLSHSDEAHYSVLLFFPVIAACFRYSLAGMIVVASFASLVCLFELWFIYRAEFGKHTEHIFEIATMIPMYPVVGLVVWLLVRRMRRDTLLLRDMVAELERTSARLIAEERMAAVGRLASSVAHEIRNPVAMISSALAIAHRADQPIAVREEFCGIASKEARRLELITTDFLRYARQRPVVKKPECVRTTLEYAAGVVRPRLDERAVSLEVECPADIEAPMDAPQVQQALINLLLNAIEHTPAHGCVHLRGIRRNGTAAIEVENPGEPVDDANREAIFEPFFTTRAEGTGLGLPMGANIARAHGGALELTANETGRVCFTLTLPLGE